MFIYIRYASKEDAGILASINSLSFTNAFRGIIPEETLKQRFSYESLKERFSKEFEEGNVKSAIMYKEDIPVGILSFIKDSSRKNDSEIDIGRIYLLPEYWGQGLGGQFLAWAINEARREGYKSLGLWVIEENTRARKAYEKAGFVHEGETRMINPGREIKDYRYILRFEPI